MQGAVGIERNHEARRVFFSVMVCFAALRSDPASRRQKHVFMRPFASGATPLRFIIHATRLLVAPSLDREIISPARRFAAQAVGIAAVKGVKLVIARKRSCPTFPPPLRVSYSIQIPKTIRLKFRRYRALSSPPLPSARAVYVRTGPQRALAGVFSISGSHLVRLVPQFESGQNCSDCPLRPAQPSK
jgi:hypothetical protein